jgi:hypothetical protein
MSKASVDPTVDERWNITPSTSHDSIQDRQDQHMTNNTTTPRSITWHDSKASYQNTASPTLLCSSSLSYAAQQKGIYKPKTSIRARPTQHSKTPSTGFSFASADNSVRTPYVQPNPYDNASTSTLLSFQQKSIMASPPPPPAPYPRDFEGFKSVEPISSDDKFVRSSHCERCGRQLRRRSFSSM